MPANVQPMLASPADHPPEGSNWVYEIKWDGVRAICYIEDGKIRLISRNGNSFDRQYPELSVIPHHVAPRRRFWMLRSLSLTKRVGPGSD